MVPARPQQVVPFHQIHTRGREVVVVSIYAPCLESFGPLVCMYRCTSIYCSVKQSFWPLAPSVRLVLGREQGPWLSWCIRWSRSSSSSASAVLEPAAYCSQYGRRAWCLWCRHLPSRLYRAACPSVCRRSRRTTSSRLGRPADAEHLRRSRAGVPEVQQK